MNAQLLSNARLAGLSLRVKLLGIFIFLVSTGFVWMATDQVIAPPVVRTWDILYRLFICRCFFNFNILEVEVLSCSKNDSTSH